MGEYSSYIFYGVLIIGIILIIVSLIKKAIKVLIFIAAILVLFSAYNVFVKGVSPIDEINGYKTDIEYSQSIASYSSKIKSSVENTKNAISSNKADINVIKTENINLHKYQSEVKVLKHTSRLNFFHDSYLKYLDSVVVSSDGALALASSTKDIDLSALRQQAEKMSSYVSELSKLKLNEKGDQHK